MPGIVAGFEAGHRQICGLSPVRPPLTIPPFALRPREPMLRLVLRRARTRFALGLAFAMAMPIWLPATPSSRIWALVAVSLLAPWLVLGRDAASSREGWRLALCDVPRAGRLVLLELVPPLIVVAVAAIVGTGGLGAPALGLFAWGAALVCVADAFDRRLGRPGPAWVAVYGAALLVSTAPLWSAFAFGYAPGTVATWAVGLHPAAMVLAAAGQSTLQDPVFYTYTLSGVVEVRPLGWGWGAAAFGLVALLGAARATRAVRRAPVNAVSMRSTP